MKQNNNDNHDRLEQLLKNMPEIQDKQSMDELYQSISEKNHSDSQHIEKRKKTWIFPTFTAAAILLIGFILSFSYFNNGPNQNETAEMKRAIVESANEESAQIFEADEGDTNFEINGFGGTTEESINNSVMYTDLVQNQQFLNLKLGMNHQDVILLLGEPIDWMDELSNFRKYKYTQEDYGLQVKFEMKSGGIIEYIFYPRFLPMQHELFQQIPRTIEDVEHIFGTNFTPETVSCGEQTLCNQYVYDLDEKRVLVIQYEQETVDFLQYAYKDTLTNLTEIEKTSSE